MTEREEPPAQVLLSWSSGKDSAWALHVLRQDPRVEVVGLLTTLNARHRRVAMHGVRDALLEAQAQSAGLRLIRVELPDPCTNEDYESRVGAALEAAKTNGVTGVAFGDLYLEDVRTYRERQVESAGLGGHFPLWGSDTRQLAEEMIEHGVRASLTCVDPRRVPAMFAGRAFDHQLLRDLPDGVDPCGENGEFHTFATHGPAFAHPLHVEVGRVVKRGDFVFADVLPMGVDA